MKQSAGLLVYREREGRPEVFLVHPGGPFWAKRDRAAWSIPKGELAEDEDPLAAACREFAEETGLAVPDGAPLRLEPVRQPGGKVVHAWCVEGDLDPSDVRSNAFEMEWPPRSGRKRHFPEIDRAAWYGLDEAKTKLHQGQIPLIEQLERELGLTPADAESEPGD